MRVGMRGVVWVKAKVGVIKIIYHDTLLKCVLGYWLGGKLSRIIVDCEVIERVKCNTVHQSGLVMWREWEKESSQRGCT